MAPPFELTFGSLDLAPYIRVGNDEGFDPYDGGGFEEPAFIDNPFGEGQGLANVDSRNREMSWPLYLNSTTKDGLHTLVRQINQEIRYAARPLRVRWKDQDATNSTYYDIEYARFDPNFRMRPSAQKWLAGVLRVWTRPYGHTATARVVGTAAATAGLPVTIPAASMMGDVDAQLAVTFGATRTMRSEGQMITGLQSVVSVLPYGWKALYTASEISGGTSAVASVTSASGAAATLANRFTTTATGQQVLAARFGVTASQLCGERARILLGVIGNANATHVGLDRRLDYAQGPIATVPMPAANGWGLIDAGTIDLDPAVSTATRLVDIYAHLHFPAQFNVNFALLVPEEHSVFSQGTARIFGASNAVGAATTVLTGASNSVIQRSDMIDNQFPSSVTDTIFFPPDSALVPVGQVPNISPGASQSVLALQYARSFNAVNTAVQVRATERFTFAR